MILNLPTQYTSWNEVFQAEYGTEVGFARETVAFTAVAGTYQIGHLVIVDNDTKAAVLPADTAALLAAAKGATAGKRVGILAGKNPRLDCTNGIDSNVIILTAGNLTETQAVVVVEGRNGGAVGKAELKFPAAATPVQKEEILKALRASQGFKFLNQQVKG